MPFSVLAVDDELAVLNVFALLIEADERFVLTGVAGNGEQAVRAAEAEHPDVIVCDLQMPTMDGTQAVPLLRKECPQAVIVVYTADPEAAQPVLDLGADAVVAKSQGPAHVLETAAELRDAKDGAA